MLYRDLHINFAGTNVAGSRTEVRFGSQHFHAGFGQRWKTQSFQHVGRSLEHALGQMLSLSLRIPAIHGPDLTGTETIGPGRAGFVSRGNAGAFCAFDADAVVPEIRERDAREVTGDIRQQISRWVTDLVEHLLSHGAGRNQTTGAIRLGHGEAAISANLSDGVAGLWQ